MRIGPLPRADTRSAGLSGVLFRVLTVVVSASLAVVAVEVWSAESEKAAPAAAAPSATRMTRPAAPQQALGPSRGIGPRIVDAGPTSSEASVPQQGPALRATGASLGATTNSNAVQDPSTSASSAGVTLLHAPEPGSNPGATSSPPGTVEIVAPSTAPGTPQIATIEEKPELPSEPASERVDLNSATLEELNGLKGGGRIGRAIVRGRPYTSPEDLLKKKVLGRTTYDRIKDQITARS